MKFLKILLVLISLIFWVGPMIVYFLFCGGVLRWNPLYLSKRVDDWPFSPYRVLRYFGARDIVGLYKGDS